MMLLQKSAFYGRRLRSEIGIASFQPAFLPTETSIRHGDINGFRLHCWATINNKMQEFLKNPSRIECVYRMNEIAEENWRNFVSPQHFQMDSHLIPYPTFDIDQHGNVLAHTANKDGVFPETRASVLGTPSLTLLDIFTT